MRSQALGTIYRFVGVASFRNDYLEILPPTPTKSIA